MAISAEKKKAINGILKGINKKFGEGSIGLASEMKEQLSVSFLKTPSLEFNLMLNGGLPTGKIIELYGENSSGKTSLCIETIAKAQKENPDFMAGWFETEGSVSEDMLSMFGVDLDRLTYWDQTNTGAEQGLDILRSLVDSGEYDLITINSVAGLSPKVEMEDSLEKAQMATTARMMSKLFRVITGSASKHKTTLVFINQLRSKVGVMFGNPETTTGGRALQFFSSVRVGMRKNKIDKSDYVTEDEAIKIVCRVQKNRMAKGNPYKKCTYYAFYGVGIDYIGEIPTVLEREGLVRKAGSWYYLEDENGEIQTIEGVEGKFRSKAVFIDALKNNEEFLQAMIKRIENEAVNGLSVDKEEINEIEKENEENEVFFEELNEEGTAEESEKE